MKYERRFYFTPSFGESLSTLSTLPLLWQLFLM
jgi:hypothetical protein